MVKTFLESEKSINSQQAWMKISVFLHGYQDATRIKQGSFFFFFFPHVQNVKAIFSQKKVETIY